MLNLLIRYIKSDRVYRLRNLHNESLIFAVQKVNNLFAIIECQGLNSGLLHLDQFRLESVSTTELVHIIILQLFLVRKINNNNHILYLQLTLYFSSYWKLAAQLNNASVTSLVSLVKMNVFLSFYPNRLFSVFPNV